MNRFNYWYIKHIGSSTTSASSYTIGGDTNNSGSGSNSHLGAIVGGVSNFL